VPSFPEGYDFYDMDPFFRDLGNLHTKFLVLESHIRTFLHHHQRLPFLAQDFETIAVGDLLEENPFTKWSHLGSLIDEYNAAVQNDPERVVERDYIVEVRNALAHGRIYRRSVESQPRLLKFSTPDRDTRQVLTEFAETLNPMLLAKWNAIMFMANRRVEEALSSLKVMPSRSA
jgi:hypothetical protein